MMIRLSPDPIGSTLQSNLSSQHNLRYVKNGPVRKERLIIIVWSLCYHP